ncbi:MAG: YdcF family protein [Paenibacillaceae bacterium]|nr:YdcF family protein [Paenibacillaceae bacterium]
MTGNRRKLLRRLLLLVACGIAALAIWTGYAQWRINTFPLFAPKGADQAHYDVGIVLGASLWGEEPSPGLKERLDTGLKLYRGGVAAKLIVTGAVDAGGTISEAAGMKRYLVAQGMPEQDVVLEEQARSTLQNLQFSKAIMDAAGWKSAIVITHRYHGSRALEIARTVGLDHPAAATTDSSVLHLGFHKTRETLALAKWKLEKLLTFGKL